MHLVGRHVQRWFFWRNYMLDILYPECTRSVEANP